MGRWEGKAKYELRSYNIASGRWSDIGVTCNSWTWVGIWKGISKTNCKCLSHSKPKLGNYLFPVASYGKPHRHSHALAGTHAPHWCKLWTGMFCTDTVSNRCPDRGGQVLVLCLPALPWNTAAVSPASGPGGAWWNCTDSSTESCVRPGWTPGAPPQAGRWGPHTPFWPSLTPPPLPAAGSCCSPAACHSVSGWVSEALGTGSAGLTGASGRASVSELPAERGKNPVTEQPALLSLGFLPPCRSSKVSSQVKEGPNHFPGIGIISVHAFPFPLFLIPVPARGGTGWPPACDCPDCINDSPVILLAIKERESILEETSALISWRPS